MFSHLVEWLRVAFEVTWGIPIKIAGWFADQLRRGWGVALAVAAWVQWGYELLQLAYAKLSELAVSLNIPALPSFQAAISPFLPYAEFVNTAFPLEETASALVLTFTVWIATLVWRLFRSALPFGK